MWPFKKNKNDNITKEDIYNGLRELDADYKKVEREYNDIQKEINEYYALAKKENDKRKQVLYAKRIVEKKKEQDDKIRRMDYIEISRSNLKKFESIVDANSSYLQISKSAFANQMKDPKAFDKFLSKSLANMKENEDSAISTREAFDNFDSVSKQNSAIGELSDAELAELAQIETERAVEEEEEMRKTGSKETQETN